jgi:hypothetical protein
LQFHPPKLWRHGFLYIVMLPIFFAPNVLNFGLCLNIGSVLQKQS